MTNTICYDIYVKPGAYTIVAPFIGIYSFGSDNAVKLIDRVRWLNTIGPDIDFSAIKSYTPDILPSLYEIRSHARPHATESWAMPDDEDDNSMMLAAALAIEFPGFPIIGNEEVKSGVRYYMVTCLTHPFGLAKTELALKSLNVLPELP